MNDHERRRADRDRLHNAPPDAGVILVRHRATGRLVVAPVENLAAARNRFDLAISTRSGGALPDLRLAEDVRTHGFDGLGFEVLESVEVEPGTTTAALRADLAVLAELWRERLGIANLQG
ncbi:MAG: GIY-YIG nuclease family protein [Chloroflexota bacterium]